MKPGIDVKLCSKLNCKNLSYSDCSIHPTDVGIDWNHNTCIIPDNCLYREIMILQSQELECRIPEWISEAFDLSTKCGDCIYKKD